jgi:hypothetical protein
MTPKKNAKTGHYCARCGRALVWNQIGNTWSEACPLWVRLRYSFRDYHGHDLLFPGITVKASFDRETGQRLA